MRLAAWMLAFGLLPLTALASAKECFPPESAGRHVNKDVCVAGHVYDVIELSDGTRFLDLCSPGTSDEQCRFTIVSMNSDRKEVGDLTRYREQEIQIRGIVRPFNYRNEIILSHERQFHGGSEKFRPNPVLLKGFSAEDSETAFRDPASRSSKHKSSFSKRH
jgi:hypothetical protein